VVVANRRAANPAHSSRVLAKRLQRWHVHHVRSWILLSILFAGLKSRPTFAAGSAPADAWITNQAQFPSNVPSNFVHAAGFESLHAEFLNGRMMILWKPEPFSIDTSVTLFASVDDLGHWPVRDWHSYPMTLGGSVWQARRPVDNINVPIAYFIQTVKGAGTNISPMRVCHPKMLGFEMPSRPFWPFLEGFEQGIESWRLIYNSTNHAAPGTDLIAKNGNHSLKVTVPYGRHSVTVATTRLRGWQIQQKGALGLRLWLRTKSGIGQARFTLYSNAMTTNQVSAVSMIQPQLTDEWQKTELPFDGFSKVELGAVDWFTIEFTGNSGTDFLVDDISLLGYWGTDAE
jgi:hypothetical protein